MMTERKLGDVSQEDGQKGNDRRERHDPFSPVLPGLILLLLVILWILNDSGYITSFVASFAIGLGGALILERLLRYPFPAYRRSLADRIVIGIALIIIGTIVIRNWGSWSPVIGITIVILFLIHSRDQRQL